MRLTREKSIRLSHVITDLLVASDDVEFVEDRDTIRQKVLQILQDLLKEEEAVDAEVRKISIAEKKKSLEGSEEWDVLYRKCIMPMKCAAWESVHQPKPAASLTVAQALCLCRFVSCTRGSDQSKIAQAECLYYF